MAGETETCKIEYRIGLAAGAVRRYGLKDQKMVCCLYAYAKRGWGLASVAALFAREGAIDWGMYLSV